MCLLPVAPAEEEGCIIASFKNRAFRAGPRHGSVMLSVSYLRWFGLVVTLVLLLWDEYRIGT
jgi:hypothetical protein